MAGTTVSLMGEYNRLRLHRGTQVLMSLILRVKYFEPKVPKTGVFISYSKLQSTPQSQNAKRAISNRRSSLPLNSARSKTPVDLIASNTAIRNKATPISSTRKRQSLTGGQFSGFSGIGSPPQATSTPLSSAHRKSLTRLRSEPSYSDPRSQLSSPTKKRASGLWPSLLFNEHESHGYDDPRRHSTTGSDLDADHSAVVAQAVAMAVSQVQAEAQSEIHNLKHKLRIATDELKEKEEQFQEQTLLLKELESTVIEFQNLHDRENAERDLASGQIEYIEELKKNHAKELEDKDKKITLLKSTVEERRSEFRTTLDALQADMQESTAAYTNEIKALQEKLLEVRVIADRVPTLERYIKNMESAGMGRSMNPVGEQDAKAQISKLAELENLLLEKEHKLQSMKEQLDQAEQRLVDYSRPQIITQVIEEPPPHHSHHNKNSHLDNTTNKLPIEKTIGELASMMDQMSITKDDLAASSTAASAKMSPQSEATISSTPPSINSLMDELPIQSHVPVQRKSKLSPNNSFLSLEFPDVLPPHHLSPSITARNIVTAVTAAGHSHIHNPNNSTLSTSHSSTKTAAELATAVMSSSPKSRRSSSISIATTILKEHIIGKTVDEKNAAEAKWCVLCDKKGHDSMNCPFEDDF